jgi:hypothetical protein
MPHRDSDPMVRALHEFATALDLPSDTTERILQCIEGKRYARTRERYAERRATGWRRRYTKPQLARRAANKRKNRAAAKAATQQLKKE